jgi:3-hydroxyisobutyrate dehydrogenase-like beta-hydroxyacid dehydrogenase
MTDATVIGLGAMGTELVRSLVKSGYATTVWNRTASRAQTLTGVDVAAAATPAEAVAASPTIISCVDKHATTRELLGQPQVREHLSGQTVIELSTGLPRDARESKAFFEMAGVSYLDGKMLTGPHGIGQPIGHFIYAGSLATYRRLEPMLKALAGRTEHVGEEIGAAAALDLAWLSGMFGLYLGVAHAASLCEAEGVPIDSLAAIFPRVPQAQWLAGYIARREHASPGAPIRLWRAALSLIQRQAADASIAAELPDFTAAILEKAMAAGHGEHHLAAIAEVMGQRLKRV